MVGRFRNIRLVALVLVLALVAGACGGKDDNKITTSAPHKTTTTSVDDATTTTSSAGVTTGSTTTVKGATSATTTTAKGTTAATKPTAPAPTTDPNAAPQPAETGTYDYAQSGSTSQGDVPASGTLVVTGGSSQVFSRYVDPREAPSDLYYVFRSDGPFITRAVIRGQGITLTCTFGSPVPAPPWPANDGRSFSGHATCDNGFVADLSGAITGHRTHNVGGKTVDVVVVSSTMHITGNGVDINVKDTQYWAPSLRVPTYSREVVSGTGPFGAPITGDVTSTLKSTTPT